MRSRRSTKACRRAILRSNRISRLPNNSTSRSGFILAPAFRLGVEGALPSVRKALAALRGAARERIPILREAHRAAGIAREMQSGALVLDSDQIGDVPRHHRDIRLLPLPITGDVVRAYPIRADVDLLEPYTRGGAKDHDANDADKACSFRDRC